MMCRILPIETKPVIVEPWHRQCDAPRAQLPQTRTPGAHLLDANLHHLLAV